MARRVPEIGLVGLGIVLRLTMLRGPLLKSYDYWQHRDYVEYVAKHWKLPSLFLNWETFQPPLFYALAALFVRRGIPSDKLGPLMVTLGCIRILLVWIGLELHLRKARLARCVALGLLAVLPCSIHVDGMLGNEAMNNLTCAAIFVEAPLLFKPLRARRALVLAALVGVVIGCALLTKYSAVAIVGALGIAVIAELLFSRAPLVLGATRFLRWPVVLVVGLLVCGTYYRRNYRLYHQVFPTAFDGVWRNDPSRNARATPYLERRPLPYWITWPPAIFETPYWPHGGENPATFMPQLIATTFVDYAGYGFAPAGKKRKTFEVNNSKIDARVLPYSRASFAGGTVIAAVTLLAWLGALIAVVRRRSPVGLFFLLSPLFVLFGQMHFTTAYPFDNMGHVKGLFFQCVALPLVALFGIAVAWVWKRCWPAALPLFAAVAMVGSYSIYCRLILR